MEKYTHHGLSNGAFVKVKNCSNVRNKCSISSVVPSISNFLLCWFDSRCYVKTKNRSIYNSWQNVKLYGIYESMGVLFSHVTSSDWLYLPDRVRILFNSQSKREKKKNSFTYICPTWLGIIEIFCNMSIILMTSIAYK